MMEWSSNPAYFSIHWHANVFSYKKLLQNTPETHQTLRQPYFYQYKKDKKSYVKKYS